MAPWPCPVEASRGHWNAQTRSEQSQHVNSILAYSICQARRRGAKQLRMGEVPVVTGRRVGSETQSWSPAEVPTADCHNISSTCHCNLAHHHEDCHHGRTNCAMGRWAAFERKREKYAELASACMHAGWRAYTFPVEVGSRGFTKTFTQRFLKTLWVRGPKLQKALKDLTEEEEQGSYEEKIRLGGEADPRTAAGGGRETSLLLHHLEMFWD